MESFRAIVLEAVDAVNEWSIRYRILRSSSYLRFSLCPAGSDRNQLEPVGF